MARQKDVPISKLPKKGKVANAIQGERNLLSIAINLCTQPNLFVSQLEEAEAGMPEIGTANANETTSFT